MIKIAVFASGSGSNAENLVNFFLNNPVGNVDCILSNNSNAYVLERSKKLGVDSLVFNREEFYDTNIVLDYLNSRKIDFIVLAGFLWLVPENLIKSYPSKIVNIHPALLPKYGGKGMYGMNVHKAVVEAKESESGITIHYVNAHYDEGNIIRQEKCELTSTDTPEDVAQKVHELEYKFFPTVIEEVLKQ